MQNTLHNLSIYLREVNTASIILRLALATICAGIIGAERGRKKRPAGFRTHILVCIGATMVMITSQYMTDVLGMPGDPGRMGAQVISGIGFLGAGTIMVVGRNQVKGLTTAAGLWSCACMGLAIGIGFYEGAIISCIFLLGVVTVLHKLDLYSRTHSKVLDIYVELQDIAGVTNFINVVKSDGTKISNLEVKRSSDMDEHTIGLMMTLTLATKCDHGDYLLQLHNIEGVCSAEEAM
ncbi:MgtC/SapB family protein [Clostridium saccharobutylicum]|uniref:Protein YhiD n=1 Tax=Clostridium saccharobutylicum DSM 13864 TaxID=1345695 RepID=U5MS10_CLOSA|nr:MgtC/SapB family protein [Clostridium saccharobutylicum]AGX43318.1 protein YhiD [Clostridium saccharobutylicum DSM 13864]AQR90618.1 putative Mg(2+) transport ATPase [Clostridium saccharobutylicum]AQS00522.1 putative Mg(2+) transport ATPase [Clostridium saccharobutylicum]AQS10174.1 putative Mg(2+) transport ATPase [Clostridium saccharobutylicum]AQS14505.1 putative Mg(2+) transport ATPase [Clostridium saccharobutylicum]